MKTVLPSHPLACYSKCRGIFQVSIDLMVSTDLRKLPLKELMEIPDNRILLPIKVDSNGENKIEIIPHKTSMGYLNGYSDPQYIKNLQTISLPFLNFGKFRAFPTEGDSIPPLKDGYYIVGKYIEDISYLKVGSMYVFITRSAGITYKQLAALHKESIEVAADNPFYAPYQNRLLMEIWQYQCSIAKQAFDKKTVVPDSSTAILQMLHELKLEVNQLKNYQENTGQKNKK
ncbi:XRE family transcriptional regulator [Chryseobacterium sp. NRRL B-14859]|uniref:S24 family peptidase n=1 Tax=Chryseobacterium sp. NRRL B-14859 TaxID=1562763 RepID=UPI0033972530